MKRTFFIVSLLPCSPIKECKVQYPDYRILKTNIMFTHLLVIGSILFLFVSIQWLSRRQKAKLRHSTQTGFSAKQEAAA